MDLVKLFFLIPAVVHALSIVASHSCTIERKATRQRGNRQRVFDFYCSLFVVHCSLMFWTYKWVTQQAMS